MLNKKIAIYSLALSFLLSIFSTEYAHAQRTISTSIEEIVVTAQKREENMQDVPSSVSAMDANTLEKTFARDLMDVAGFSPNLIIDPILGNGTAAISIRGIQMNDVEKSFDPAVAVYQDGIYLATATAALLNTWDAERIEVLRGPQGTMFGRNTVGGLVHVIRSKPTGELGGKINLTAAEDSFLAGVFHLSKIVLKIAIERQMTQYSCVGKPRNVFHQYARLPRREDRAFDPDGAVEAGLLRQQILLTAHILEQAHDKPLPDGIDGWVGHLSKALLEIVIETAIVFRQECRRRVITHGA